MKRRLLTLVAALSALGAGAQAHHSLAGVYDSSRPATVEAVVTEFHFVNPHPFVMAEVKERDGTARPYRLEMDNRRELVDVGITDRTFQRGDRIVVTGSVGRSDRTHMYIRRLERPADGFLYEQVGTRPRVGKRS
jgi:hypothetical protein